MTKRYSGFQQLTYQKPSIHYNCTTPAAIIGEAERIWFHRRRYRTVKIVLLRMGLELELRLLANGKKCLENASKAQIFGLPH